MHNDNLKSSGTDSNANLEWGQLPLCQIKKPTPSGKGLSMFTTPSPVTECRYVAVPISVSLTDAKTRCEKDYAGLASIHSAIENSQATHACSGITQGRNGRRSR